MPFFFAIFRLATRVALVVGGHFERSGMFNFSFGCVSVSSRGQVECISRPSMFYFTSMHRTYLSKSGAKIHQKSRMCSSNGAYFCKKSYFLRFLASSKNPRMIRSVRGRLNYSLSCEELSIAERLEVILDYLKQEFF